MPGLSRRHLLAALPVAALAGCAKPPVRITRPTASPTGPVAAQLDQVMGVYRSNTPLLGMYVRDLRTGHDWSLEGQFASQNASMAKVMIGALALRRARSEGHDLDFERMTDLSKMIVESDNDSADRLWRYVGGDIEDASPANLGRAADAYSALAADLGMTASHRDETRPDWSWTWTTPQDQVTLLQRLQDGTSALTDVDRLYLFDVMRKTVASQTWGVGTRRGEHVKVQMKNGWVQFGTGQYPGKWAVNSMGLVDGEGRRYSAAIMSRTDTFEQGKALLDAMGADLFRVLGTGTL